MGSVTVDVSVAGPGGPLVNMVHRRNLLPILVTVVVVTAAAVTGIGDTPHLTGSLSGSAGTVADSANLQQYTTVVERTIASARDHLRSVTAPVDLVLAHPSKLLLLFELGLLVEHLRLLTRADDNLAYRLDRTPTNSGEDRPNQEP